MKSGRFIHVDVMENRKPMVLDRKTNTLVPADSVDQGRPEKLEIIVKHRNESPEQTLQRSAKVIKEMKGLPSVKLTVGDLSLAKAQKNSPERVRQQLQAMDRGLSVGDLSHVTDAKDSVEGELQKAKAERDGLTVGDLFQGRRCTQPNMSKRQELEAAEIQKHRKKVDEKCRISELLSGRDEALEEYAEKHLKSKTA